MKKKKEISPQKWGICAITFLIVLLGIVALLTCIVDPYFHYHPPIPGMSYRLYEQRYINDGISRNFEYDTLVIGNSLAENVKTSQVDELFEANSIKLPYSGAGYKELWESVERSLAYNENLKRVIVFIDFEDAIQDKDYVRYTDYPDYLYDNNPWNDAAYLWNKDILYRGTLYNLAMTLAGRESTTFDEYSAKDGETGAEVVLSYVGEIPKEEEIGFRYYDEDDEQKVTDNINTNIISVMQQNPETEFYLIYSPPSIARWARYYGWGDMSYRIAASRTATRLLLQEENVKVYSFVDEFELVCDLDNYRDTVHCTSAITDYMIEAIAQGKKQITSENMENYFENITEFYTEYDYYLLMEAK